MKAEKARLDADRKAAPRTRIVARVHLRDGDCWSPAHATSNDLTFEEGETETPLTPAAKAREDSKTT
jgi:hypothetical protein